jgi:predicted phosphoserine aminotransferase
MNDSEGNSKRQRRPRSSRHIKLFVPGPTEVQPEILDAQSEWMIGHRMAECADLFATIQPKLRQVFQTENRVLISASSGTGLLEAAIRNCSDRRVLNCVNGAFSDRWRQTTEANGKANEVLEVDWGEAILPELVARKLATGGFDAVTVAHNETSTGVTSPVKEIARAVREAPGGDGIMLLVDSVSGLAGARLEVDEWDLDVVVTSSQKALALPPGLAFCSVSERAVAKAKTVANRGYYFDFLKLIASLEKNQTPATPAISLLYALDRQLTRILAEGMENRYARHLAMRDATIAWAAKHGITTFAAAGYESPTVTCLRNEGQIDIGALNGFLRQQGMIISNGYGARLRDKTFRIAHMGELQMADMESLFGAMDEFPALKAS